MDRGAWWAAVHGVAQSRTWLKWLSSSSTSLYALATWHLCIFEAKSLQSCPTLCSPLGCSLPGSSVHGILQARILEWVAMPSSRGSSRPRDWTRVSCSSYTGRRVLYPGGFFAIWETGISVSLCLIPSLSCDLHTRLLSLLCLSARGCQFLLSSQREAQFLPLGPAWFQCLGLSCLGWPCSYRVRF